MKQITNKEYEEWQKYKAEKAKVRPLLPEFIFLIIVVEKPFGSNGPNGIFFVFNDVSDIIVEVFPEFVAIEASDT